MFLQGRKTADDIEYTIILVLAFSFIGLCLLFPQSLQSLFDFSKQGFCMCQAADRPGCAELVGQYMAKIISDMQYKHANVRCRGETVGRTGRLELCLTGQSYLPQFRLRRAGVPPLFRCGAIQGRYSTKAATAGEAAGAVQ